MRRSNMMDYGSVPKEPVHELLARFIDECMAMLDKIETLGKPKDYHPALSAYRVQVEGYCQILRLMEMTRGEHVRQVADRLEVHQERGYWNNSFDMKQVVMELRQYADKLDAEAKERAELRQDMIG